MDTEPCDSERAPFAGRAVEPGPAQFVGLGQPSCLDERPCLVHDVCPGRSDRELITEREMLLESSLTRGYGLGGAADRGQGSGAWDGGKDVDARGARIYAAEQRKSLHRIPAEGQNLGFAGDQLVTRRGRREPRRDGPPGGNCLLVKPATPEQVAPAHRRDPH